MAVCTPPYDARRQDKVEVLFNFSTHIVSSHNASHLERCGQQALLRRRAAVEKQLQGQGGAAADLGSVGVVWNV